SATATQYTTTFSITLTNLTNKAITDVAVLEEIPKNIAADTEEIVTESRFVVLKEDPVVKFLVDIIEPNSTAEITYRVNKNVTVEDLNNVRLPAIIDFKEKVAKAPPKEIEEEKPREVEEKPKEEAVTAARFASQLLLAVGVLIIAIIIIIALFALRRKRH
ncbi:MAG: hypothetical protein J7L14_03330, partial [Candidatus Diapherotrites archaeon]|nr:hypothetical protein [Candidatus Diapherotrites archaeon]